MLLRTDKGEDNKIYVPRETRNAAGQHSWTREAGYQPAERPAGDYPKMLYKQRFTGFESTRRALMAIVGIKNDGERKAAYLKALADLAETGQDIRQFPIELPETDVLVSLLRIVGSKMESHEREEWLQTHPEETIAQYRLFIKSPETSLVNSEKEEKQAIAAGWSLSYDFTKKAA